MIHINFAPRKYVESIRTKLIIAKILLVAFLAVIVVAVISTLRYAKYIELSQEYTNLTKERELLKGKLDDVNKITKDIKEIETYVSQIESLSSKRYIYVAFMQDLVNNLPVTVWFSGITTRTQSDYIDVTLNVNSNTLEDLLWWYSYMENNKKRYSDTKISAINYTSDYYTTQISFKYRYAI